MPDPVLILGAGINGAALARELVLNQVDVVVVDRRDIAFGATAYSSRLVHGGLRYLEYGEFSLVKESLAERTRLLQLAPQFVHPLRLTIPVRNRFGGMLLAARRFLGMNNRPSTRPLHRGLWTVRLGLWLYDNYARDPSLPRRSSHRTGAKRGVPIDPSAFPWACEFSDAQVFFPERFTLALLEDARQIARANGTHFEVRTYCDTSWDGHTATIQSNAGAIRTEQITPSTIVNATGAWVDFTLASLGIESPRLMGGTKGSHFITHHAPLAELLAGRAVYTEAGDGRPVFILPFAHGTLVGTTDVPFEGDPASAVATPDELQYLVAAVNEVFPQLGLSTDDIALHYAGVRPLPQTSAASTAAITRRHWLQSHDGQAVPCYSIIGGKLTTCRSLADDAAQTILARLNLPHIANSRERPLPGSQGVDLQTAREGFSDAASIDLRKLLGSRAGAVVGQDASAAVRLSLVEPNDQFNRIVRWFIDHEWVARLDDLVERRLMLLYHPALTRECLNRLADQLVAAGKLSGEGQQAAVEAVVQRLQQHFGKRIQ